MAGKKQFSASKQIKHSKRIVNGEANKKNTPRQINFLNFFPSFPSHVSFLLSPFCHQKFTIHCNAKFNAGSSSRFMNPERAFSSLFTRIQTTSIFLANCFNFSSFFFISYFLSFYFFVGSKMNLFILPHIKGIKSSDVQKKIALSSLFFVWADKTEAQKEN